jgi:hypothetical protein
MFKSVSLISFKEGTDQERREAVLAAYRKLPSLIPGIVSFEVGLDHCTIWPAPGIMRTSRKSGKIARIRPIGSSP